MLQAFTSEISNLQESPGKEIQMSVESVPLKTGTNGPMDQDSGPVSVTICLQPLETSLPVTTDPVLQLNIPTKTTVEEAEEVLRNIKQAKAIKKQEGVTQSDALKPELIGTSTLKPGLVNKDKEKNIEDMVTESDLQEMLKESNSKPIEKERVNQSANSEDQQKAVSFLAAVPTPPEDTALVH